MQHKIKLLSDKGGDLHISTFEVLSTLVKHSLTSLFVLVTWNFIEYLFSILIADSHKSPFFNI